MRGDKTGKQGYSLLGEGFSERVIYSIKLAFPLESPHWFFSLSLIPHATDIPMFKLCVFCKSWHSSLHYVFAHGKIHSPRCNIAAKLFRNPSVLGRMVFAFWKHSSKMYMDDHRKQAQLNSLKRHFWMMWRIYWAILWKLNCWFSASHKKCMLVELFWEVCLDKKSCHVAASPFKTNLASILPQTNHLHFLFLLRLFLPRLWTLSCRSCLQKCVPLLGEV